MATKKKLKGGFFAEFLTAGSATATACIFTNPLEVVKTRLQLQGELATAGSLPQRGLFKTFTKIFQDEGVRGLQRGLVPGMVYQVVMNGTRLGVYGKLKTMTGADNSDASFVTVRTMVAGGTAGVIGACLASPLAMVKVRLQAQSSAPAAEAVGHQHQITGLTSALRTILREEGPRGLFRGFEGAALRVAVGSAAQLSCYDGCKRMVLTTGVAQDGLSVHIASSLVAGLVVTTAMNPFDVVSTRLYNQKVVNGVGVWYTGPIDCLRATVASEGVAGLYKGWLAHYLRLGPHTVLTFVFWEQFKRVALDTFGEEEVAVL